MTTQTATLLASCEVQEVFGNVLMAFAQDPNFREKGPGAFYFHKPGKGERIFTFSDSADEPVLRENLLKAYEDTGRGIFNKGKTSDGLYVSMVSKEGALMVLFGWTWDDGLAFLLAVAKQLKLEVPIQASASLSRSAHEALPTAVRALL